MLAIVGALGIGLVGTNTMPLLLGAIMDGLDVGPGRAGAVGSLELGAIALISLGLAPRMGRFSLSSLYAKASIAGGLAAAVQVSLLPYVLEPFG